MPGLSPTPTGLGIGPVRTALADGRTHLHVELLQEASRHPGEPVNRFTLAETFRHYILDRNIIGSLRKDWTDQSYIHRYKAYYVHAMRDPIRSAAAHFQLPAVLVAGMIYNEVGGSDLIKPYVHALRDLFSHEDADRTSIGPTSLQVRRALESLGYDPSHVDPSVKRDVVESLIDNHPFAIFVAARHLSDLRDRFAPGSAADDMSDDELAMLGARYNQGPDAPADRVGKDLSYGRRILERRAVLVRLLGNAPVAEPDWGEPLERGLKQFRNFLN
jgi:hypothetical protein